MTVKHLTDQLKRLEREALRLRRKIALTKATSRSTQSRLQAVWRQAGGILPKLPKNSTAVQKSLRAEWDDRIERESA